MRKTLCIGLTVVFLIMGVTQVQAFPRLFATDHIRDSLLLIDPITGEATVIGPFGIGNVTGTALAFAPDGTLWGAFQTTVDDYLVNIDTSTGKATIVAPLRPRFGGRGVEFGPDGKTFYLVNIGNQNLYTIDISTGLGTLVGCTGFDTVSLALLDNKFYAITVDVDDYLITIEPTTGAGAPVGPLSLPFDPVISGLASSSDGKLFAVDWANDLLIEVDSSTGAGTVIGSLGLNVTSGGMAFEPEKEVEVDIKPQSCPNPLNVGSRGVLPVAILGTEDFDVTTIDPASIRLEGVAPIRSNVEDVSTPVVDRQNICDCTTEGSDGFDDLALKFATREIVGVLGEVADGDIVILTLTGNLKEEFKTTPIKGEDCVVIISEGP